MQECVTIYDDMQKIIRSVDSKNSDFLNKVNSRPRRKQKKEIIDARGNKMSNVVNNQKFKIVKLSKTMYINELTETMDKYVKQPSSYGCTYLYLSEKFLKKNMVFLRYSGMTVGYFTFDHDGIVETIRINEDACIYNDNVKKEIDKFKGWVFNIPADKRMKTM